MTCICITIPLQIVMSKIQHNQNKHVCRVNNDVMEWEFKVYVDDVGKYCKDFIKIPKLLCILVIYRQNYLINFGAGVKTFFGNMLRVTINKE